MQRRKHVPQRTCVVCRQKTDKRQFTRIVRTPDDGVTVDLTGKRNGRGAYLCQNPACWDKVMTEGILEQALLTKISSAEMKRLMEFRPDASPPDKLPQTRTVDTTP